MEIIPSAEIRLNYNGVVEKCKESGEPVYLTRNGQGELVVMDIASFEKKQQELKAQQLVLEALADELFGSKTYSNEEVFSNLDKMLSEAKKWITTA